MPVENWKPLRNFEDVYEISDRGRIRSRPRYCATRGGGRRLLAARVLRLNGRDRDGYVIVRLIDARGKAFPSLKLHRLVAKHFCIGESATRSTVNHIDMDKTHNDATNLEWLSNAENIRHAADNGAWTKVPPDMQQRVGSMRQNGFKWREISQALNIPISTAYGIHRKLSEMAEA